MQAVKFTESTVEEAALAWLGDLGYSVLHGPQIAPDSPTPERRNWGDVVLVGRLRVAIARLNPNASRETQEDALRKVLRLDAATLIERNRLFHRMLVDGVEVEYSDDEGRVRGTRIDLVDFEHIEVNDWVALNQLTIIEAKRNRRPDVVICLNGLPLAVFELKDAGNEKATIDRAFNQLQTYKNDIPLLFDYNELLVISDGLEARAGSLTASRERFMPWRTIEGEELASEMLPELRVLIEGVFERRRFLDYVRHFVVFEEDGARVAKIAAGYHQFHATNRAVAATLRASEVTGDHRAGVVWHTQGSGKSLTMLFYSGRMVLHPAMGNPTVVVITDRNDLDDQLFTTFARCSEALRQAPVQAASAAHLRELLRRASGGVVFTTVQKFVPDEKGGGFPLLSDRRNIIVIADEAHRSQYDFIDGFARRLREALPNASFIGFTGTPIELTDKSTKAVFGDYISIYDIKQAVDDGATVPILYESRLAKLELSDRERPTLDRDFDEATEGEEIAHREKLKSKWAALEALVGTDKRLELIAEDLVEHYEKRLEAIEGKAMVVCMSRRICVDLYEAIVKLRPEWHSEDDDKGALKVVMTGSASDTQEWQPHIRNKARRESLALRFKAPEDPFKVVIVRDMWLTGFDAPSLHTMYVDKPMRGHGLMQAIARVNRVFRDKPCGLVVDYLGLADELRSALADYSTAGGRGRTAVDQGEVVAVMREKYEICTALWHGFDYSPFLTGKPGEQLEVLKRGVEHVLAQEDGKARLLQVVTELSQAFALAVPHDDAMRIRDDVAFFQRVRSALAKKDTSGRPFDEVDHAVREIVSRALVSEEVVDIFALAGLERPDISIISDEFLAEVRDLPQKNLAVELLERLLNDGIKSRARKNVVEARSFSELLEKSLLRYRNRAIEAAQVIEELIELAKSVKAAATRGEELGLSDDEVAFYDALAANESAVAVLGDDTLRDLAKQLVRTVRGNATIDWTIKESVRANLRRLVKRMLRKYGYPPDKAQLATDTVLAQAEQLSLGWILEAPEMMTAAGEEPSDGLAVVRLLRDEDARPFENCLPLYSLEAAAGRFGTGGEVDREGWAEVLGGGVLDEDMFVARIAGRSMEPRLHDGDYGVFRWRPAGTRNGKIVLVQYRGPADPETGGSYTVKRYRSSKRPTEDGWEHDEIILEPLNPEFDPIVIDPTAAADVQVIAELLRVLDH